MEFNFADLFEGVADAVPDREFLIADPVRHTYRSFDEAANRIAHHLKSQGVKPGDHVGIYAYNRADFVEIMMGCYKIRAVPINVNFRYVEEELRYIFENADLVALAFERTFAPRVAKVVDDLPKLKHLIVLEDGSGEDLSGLDAVTYEEATAAASPERDFEPRSADDIYIIYTGGTTGMPKGVMWRHEDIFMALCGGIDFYTGEPMESPEAAVARAPANETPLTMLFIPPLMHGASQVGTWGQGLQGHRIMLYTEHSFDASKIWQLVDREKANGVFITGDAMARPLIEELQANRDAYDLSSLVSFSSSAAVFSPALKQQFLGMFPNVVLTDAIGATESGFNGIQMVQAGQEEKPRGVRVSPGPDTTVLDEETLEPIEAGSDQVGKLARGGNIPLGYYNDPKKTAEVFVESGGKRWVLAGDYALVESDGTIVLLGRGSQVINSGGEKIYVEEVEQAIRTHPDVYDAVVVGVPDERWGSRVAAVVQPREGKRPSLEDIQAHARDRIAGYKVPRELHVVEAMQRHPSGKPDYPWAKKIAESGESLVTSGT